MTRLLVCVLALLALCPAARAARVVSLNLCTDQYLVLLAPEQVAGLTLLSRDPSLSVVARQAAHLPVIRPDAEALLARHPSLVLAAAWGAQTTLAALERQGVRVVRSPLPQDFAGIRAETTRLAALLGHPERGAALLARMNAILAAAPPATGRGALWLEPRGFTAAPDSLQAAVLRAAGLASSGAGRQLGLESLVAHPPALLVVSRAPSYPSLATDLLTHPALQGIPRRSVPPALVACAGPWTAGAVAVLEGK